ncbi:MAG: GNAT family N-acetyltransferase [Candidatus Paracaedibacter sp.]
MVSLIPLTTRDGKILEYIHATCFPDAWGQATFDVLLKETSTCGWLAMSFEEEPVGLILTRVLDREAEILTFAVIPTFQNRGVGRYVLKELLLFLTSVGCEKIFLEVAMDNEAAIALYASLGFTTVGTRLNYYKRADQSLVSAFVMCHVFG